MSSAACSTVSEAAARSAKWKHPQRSHSTLNLVLPEHVFDAIEQVAFVFLAVRPRLELFFRRILRELLQQLALLARDLLRRLHLHRREQVAASTAVHVRHA